MFGRFSLQKTTTLLRSRITERSFSAEEEVSGFCLIACRDVKWSGGCHVD